MGGYSFLRNQELEPYRGGELLVRVAICSAVYAGLWAAIWGMKHFLAGSDGTLETFQMLIMAIPPVVIGSLTALSSLDLDFGSGFFHYALYVAVCVLLRLTMGLTAL